MSTSDDVTIFLIGGVCLGDALLWKTVFQRDGHIMQANAQLMPPLPEWVVAKWSA
jgi:hypothetical protein